MLLKEFLHIPQFCNISRLFVVPAQGGLIGFSLMHSCVNPGFKMKVNLTFTGIRLLYRRLSAECEEKGRDFLAQLKRRNFGVCTKNKTTNNA